MSDWRFSEYVNLPFLKENTNTDLGIKKKKHCFTVFPLFVSVVVYVYSANLSEPPPPPRYMGICKLRTSQHLRWFPYVDRYLSVQYSHDNCGKLIWVVQNRFVMTYDIITGHQFVLFKECVQLNLVYKCT